MTAKKPATTRARSAAAKAAPAKTATADTAKEPVVAAGLQKFINPEAAPVEEQVVEETAQQEESATVEAQGDTDQTATASAGDVTTSDETVTTGNDGPETSGDEVEVVVVVDAVTVRPGLLASKGQSVTLPAAQAARLTGLGAVRKA